MEYTVGFLFDGPKDFVALILKNRPAWQVGLLNGPGGKMKPGETPAQTQHREFLEECGVDVQPEKWWPFARLECPNGDRVHFLTAYRNCNLASLTDEKVNWYSLAGVRGADLPVIPNLLWLVPLALDQWRERSMTVISAPDNPA